MEAQRRPAVTVAPEHVGSEVAIGAADVRFSYSQSRRRNKAGAGSRGPALDGVSLDIKTGETVSLLGPNGSGKSTLLRILATLLQADSGQVRIFGSDNADVIRRKLGVVFQRPGLDGMMTVRENLADSARLQGLTGSSVRSAVNQGLEAVGVAERADDRVKTLSGGLARRVDLCRALLHDPPLLLLDEPTTGLDPTARRTFMDLIDAHRRQRNMTVLMTTHLTDEAERSDRVVLMHKGKIVASDTPGGLRRAAGSTRVLLHDEQWQPPDDCAAQWSRSTAGWQWQADDNESLARQTAALIDAGVAFTVAPPTLADAFEQMTGETLHEAQEPG